MRKFLSVLALLSPLFAISAYAGGIEFGTGAAGVCGKEQTVFDGQTTGVIRVSNIASDTNVINLKHLYVAVRHADGLQFFDALTSPDTVTPLLSINPHQTIERVYVLKPHPSDLGLPNQILSIVVIGVANVTFSPGNTSQDFMEIVPDQTRVLTANPAVCTGSVPLLDAVTHTKYRDLSDLK